MSFTKEEILAKIKKLEAMAACTGNEAINAKNIIANLIEKYKIHPEEMPSAKKRYTIKVHRLKKWALRLSNWMGVVAYTMHGAPDFIQVDLDSDEYKMWYCLLDDIKHLFNQKEREFKLQYEYDLQSKNEALYSFMLGYMKSNYPTRQNYCSVCKKENAIVDNVCQFCHTKYGSSSFHKQFINRDSYQSGINTKAVKKLNQSNLALEHK